MNVSVQNLEEAASIASEFIYSLDNLPNEVAHLLQEIKHRDARVQELQREVEKDSARYIRHQLRNGNSSNPNSNPNSTAPSPSSNNGKSGGSSHLGLPEKISAAYAELNALADEKIALARRLIELFMRTRARLDIDLSKVRVLQGEAPEPSPALGVATSSPNVGVKLERTSTSEPSSSVQNPLQVSESLLKNALAASSSSADLATPTPSTSAVVPKKRRLAASGSIKLPARASTPPTPAPPPTTPMPRSRLSRQIHIPPAKKVDEDEDMEAEGDDEGEDEDEDDADDERLYCFCQKRSYGDMIACDNEGKCPYEWFHLGCVGLKQPTPDKWYCSECLSKGAGAARNSSTGSVTVGRKGRKKQ